MKKTLNIIVTLLMAILFLMPLYACDKSKPTEAFQNYSRYIEINGISKTLHYNNLKDDYFGDFSVHISASEHYIYFFFLTSDKNRSLDVTIYDSDPAFISVTYTLSELTVGMKYTNLHPANLYSSTSYEVSFVSVGDVIESESSYFYSNSVKLAQQTLEKAVPWMTKMVKNCYGDYTVHSLYRH